MSEKEGGDKDEEFCREVAGDGGHRGCGGHDC